MDVAFNPATQPAPPGKQYVAIWDTGATGSVISQKVIDECGLKQTGLTQVQGVNAITIEPTFLVSIRLPNNVGFQEVQVTRGTLGHGNDVLIGMDIITTGDFVITNKDGFTWWSFCWPSHRRTDYVAEHQVKAKFQQSQHHGHGPRPKRHK
ncbi:MAG TPA: retropepsin-like aspartic protease [Steroidobacteraceae bacterium]|nr:retropepsin-like aspartic protease [Steroidobacteraceae bacterium]